MYRGFKPLAAEPDHGCMLLNVLELVLWDPTGMGQNLPSRIDRIYLTLRTGGRSLLCKVPTTVNTASLRCMLMPGNMAFAVLSPLSFVIVISSGCH